MSKRTDRVEAVIDWVEIEIQAQESTNFQTVQRAFALALQLPKGLNPHVKPICPNGGGGAYHFLVRLHDIKRHGDIDTVLKKASTKLKLCQGWHMRKIELAIDMYCDDPADQAARFYKFMANPVSKNRRMYREKLDLRSFGVPNNFDSLNRFLREGWQIGIGDEDDEHYQHIYFKTTDGVEIIGWEADAKSNKQKPIKRAKTLPPDQWRARTEIRLSGAALPFQTPEEWRQCKFEKLMHYFRQRVVKDNLDPFMQTLANATEQIGERKTRKKAGGGVRLHSKSTKADPVNGAIRQALKNLSDRWCSTGKRGRPPKSESKTACGNSGGFNGHNPREHGEQYANSNNYICTTNNIIDELMQQYESTPGVKVEADRIDTIMGAYASGEAPPPQEAKS